jgi:predicted aminopeptidase
LLGTIFHELAHEQLYVAGDTEFNEAYATVVSTAGIRRWYAARPSPELDEWERQEAREREFVALLVAARARLQQLYAGGAPVERMRIAKNREFGLLKFEYGALRARWGGYAGYDAWFGRALNNAHLAAVATYEDCVPGLVRELEGAGSLQAFYGRAAQLARLTRTERHALVCTAP